MKNIFHMKCKKLVDMNFSSLSSQNAIVRLLYTIFLSFNNVSLLNFNQMINREVI